MSAPFDIIPAPAVLTAVKAVMKHIPPLLGTVVDDHSYIVQRLCGVLEAVLVHGIQPGASAAEAIPLKSIILMAWASHSTPVATKHASDAELRQLVSIVTAVVSATHVMTTSGFARAWIRLVLNHGLFAPAVQCISFSRHVLSLYDDDALLNQSELVNALVELLAPLAKINFRLVWDDASLDDKPLEDFVQPASFSSVLYSVSSAIKHAFVRVETPSLIQMSMDSHYCTNAHIDPTIAVPELVLACIRYLQLKDHVPGVMLTGLHSAPAEKLIEEFHSTGVFPDPDALDSDRAAYTVAAALYTFLLSLPDSPIPSDWFKPFIACASLPNHDIDASEQEDVVAVALASVHEHAVDRPHCKSPKCRNYRQLFDELPLAHRSLLAEVLPFLARLCGVWEIGDSASPVAIRHLHALSCAIGPALFRPGGRVDDDATDVAVIPKVVMDLLLHHGHIVHETLVRRRVQLKIANEKMDALVAARRKSETEVNFKLPGHTELLKRLWDAALKTFAEEQRLEFNTMSPLWTEFGFQRPNPVTDFRGGGLLALEFLVFYAENCPGPLHKSLLRLALIRPSLSASAKPANLSALVGWYPIALAGIHVTRLLLAALHVIDREAGNALAVGAAVAKEYPVIWSHLQQSDVLARVFATCMLVLDATYLTDQTLTINDFTTVSTKVVHDCIALIEASRPATLSPLKLHHAWMEQHGFVTPEASSGAPEADCSVKFGAPLDPSTETSHASVLDHEAYGRDVTFDCPLKGCPSEPQPPPPSSVRTPSGSEMLSTEQAAVLASHLPSSYAGYKWILVYSLAKHGASLETLLAKCRTAAPTLLAIKDSKGTVFGGYVSDPWRRSTSYFGSGQSFVFSFHNSSLPKARRQSDVSRFRVYKWSRENSYFQNVTDTHLCMGGGGAFAIFLDEDLNAGTSGVCGTFSSPCLAASASFECVSLELWTFAP